MVEHDAPFSISRVRITGFKSIRKSFELNLNDIATIVVGDNGAGKTTIIEAVHLALSGRYRETPIARCISEYLFNKDAVAAFVKDTTGGVPFPEICIDVYLDGGDKPSQAKFSGSFCPEKAKNCGFSFKIEFDNDYLEELENVEIESLPVEYYVASWTSFAGEKLTPRGLPVTSLLLNPNGDMRPSFGTDRATRSLLDMLGKEEHVALSQSARKGKTLFRDAVRNGNTASKLNGSVAFKAGEVALDVNIGSADSWYRDLTVAISGVPYENIGAGPQCLLQSEISFGFIADGGSKSFVVLIEEPENHLSYGNLNKLLSLLELNDSHQFLCTTHSSFVANKLGLQNLIIVGKAADGICSLDLAGLSAETYEFFRKLPGFETLRLALVDKAILVEGPSDELIVQRAYRDKCGKPPLSNGIDVISVGLTYGRFLEIAECIGKRVAVITDNDDHPEKVEEKFKRYADCDTIRGFYDSVAYTESHDDHPKLRLNTLEATLVRSAGREALCKILKYKVDGDHELMQYMESHKTESALRIFDSLENIKYPDYITNAIEWIECSK